MSNSAKFNIDSSPAGSHSIFLQQDVKVLTIHSLYIRRGGRMRSDRYVSQ